MSEQIEITIKIPVSYFEKLRLESTTSNESTTGLVETGSTGVNSKNEFMNIINQLPEMVKNMLPKDLEKMNKDEQKTFVITLTKTYPQMKEMVSDKMINDLSSYFQCKSTELGFIKKFKYQQPSDSSPPPVATGTSVTSTPAVVGASASTTLPPQMQDMFAGIMGMMKPPAPLKEGETPPPQPSMQDLFAGIMGMMQPAAGTSAAVGTETGTGTAISGSKAAATVVSKTVVEEAD